MILELKKRLRIIKKSKKIKVFYFGSTVKKESNNFYITEIKENKKFIYFGAVIFNNYHAKKIAKIIDGNVDFALIDVEKKIVSKNKSIFINIERAVKDVLKNTKIFTYKGNDLTVQACETLINYIYLNDIRGIGGKNILVLGSGNIGFKISQKLVESGGNVYMYRRNQKILEKIVFTINALSPKATVAKARKIKSLSLSLNKYDLIIGTTNGVPLINKEHIKKLKKKLFIIDVGKGILKKDALDLAISKNINLFRLDITPAYDGYLENVYSTEKLNNINLIKSKIVKNLDLVKRGILGKEGSIIVDNVIFPKKIYGISDGKGSFKKTNNKKILEIKQKLLIK